VQEKEKTPDKADAYRAFLTNYCAKISHFKEILPCGVSAYGEAVFLLYRKFLEKRVSKKISLQEKQARRRKTKNQKI